jgi:hypothetical protein
MRWTGASIVAFVSLATVGAAAAPVGLDVALETAASDLQSPEEFEITVQPELEYALGDTGLTLGLSWEVPVIPDPAVGALEGIVELEVVLPGVALVAGNSIVVDLETHDLEGYGWLTAGHDFGGLAAELELEFAYAPAAEIVLIPRLIWEKQVGRGTLELTVEQGLVLYDTLEPGETELVAGYELPVAGSLVGFEVEGVIDGGSFALAVLARLERPL